MSQLRHLIGGAWKRRGLTNITPGSPPVTAGTGFGKAIFGQSTFGG